MMPSVLTVMLLASAGALHSEVQARSGTLLLTETLIVLLVYAAALLGTLAAWLVWALVR